MSLDEFKHIWKDSTKDEILKQYYFDYINWKSVIKEWQDLRDKAIEQAKEKIKGYKETIDMLIVLSVENKRYEIAELRYRIREQEDLIDILQNGSDNND